MDKSSWLGLTVAELSTGARSTPSRTRLLEEDAIRQNFRVYLHRDSPPQLRLLQTNRVSPHRDSPPQLRLLQKHRVSPHRDNPPQLRLLQKHRVSFRHGNRLSYQVRRMHQLRSHHFPLHQLPHVSMTGHVVKDVLSGAHIQLPMLEYPHGELVVQYVQLWMG